MSNDATNDAIKAALRGALRSRLVRLGAALVLLSVTQVVMARYGAILSPELQGAISALVGVIVVALRADTTQSLAEKGASPAQLP